MKIRMMRDRSYTAWGAPRKGFGPAKLVGCIEKYIREIMNDEIKIMEDDLCRMESNSRKAGN